MKWDRLKNFKCAGCNGQLEHQVDYDRYACTKCDFTIGKEKFNKIVSGQHNKYKEPDRSGWEI